MSHLLQEPDCDIQGLLKTLPCQTVQGTFKLKGIKSLPVLVS